MNVIERNKLFLVWLSCKDFNSLKRGKNQDIITSVWKHTKKEIEDSMNSYTTSMRSIAEQFGKIRLTVDPRKSCSYDPQEEGLTFNLWKLFFAVTSDEKFCSPTPAWQTGGILVHEFDHYNYLKESGMSTKAEKEQEEFKKEYSSEIERRAFLKQKAFFETCEARLPTAMQTYIIRIEKWSKLGAPSKYEVHPVQLTRDSINNAVIQITRVIEQIDKGEKYDEMSETNDVKNSLRMMELLSLPFKMSLREKDYPSIEIDM